MARDGYAYAVLADGARPYLHRAGVRALLGVAEETGVRVSFARAATRRFFRYVHEYQGDTAAPSGWDEVLAQAGSGEQGWRGPATDRAGQLVTEARALHGAEVGALHGVEGDAPHTASRGVPPHRAVAGASATEGSNGAKSLFVPESSAEAESRPVPDGYGHAVLADGAQPYLHRAGVRALLGVAEETGVRVRFATSVPGRSFGYVHEQQGDSAAPTGWDEVLAQTGTTLNAPSSSVSSVDAAIDPAIGVKASAEADAVEWSTGHGSAHKASAGTAGAAQPRVPEPTGTAIPSPPVVTEMVVPDGRRRSGTSDVRSRVVASETRHNEPAPAPVPERHATTAGAPPEAVAVTPPAAPARPHRTVVRMPDRAAMTPSPTTQSATEVPVSVTDLVRIAPSRELRSEPTRDLRNEPSTATRPVPQPTPAAPVPSRQLPTRRPVLRSEPTDASPELDPIASSPSSPRRHTTPPYRRTAPLPSAAPTPPQRQSADPTPTPITSHDPAPAPARIPAQPQVVVVRAPAAPPGEAAFWERRYLGRLLNGVVR